MCYCTVVALFYFEFEGNFQFPGGLYLEGVLIQRRSFALWVWGAYIWRGLYMAGLIFRILRETWPWIQTCAKPPKVSVIVTYRDYPGKFAGSRDMSFHLTSLWTQFFVRAAHKNLICCCLWRCRFFHHLGFENSIQTILSNLASTRSFTNFKLKDNTSRKILSEFLPVFKISLQE